MHVYNPSPLVPVKCWRLLTYAVTLPVLEYIEKHPKHGSTMVGVRFLSPAETFLTGVEKAAVELFILHSRTYLNEFPKRSPHACLKDVVFS